LYHCRLDQSRRALRRRGAPDLSAMFPSMACRACGAVKAPPQGKHTNPIREVCGDCWDMFVRFRSGDGEPTEPEFNAFLVRRLLSSRFHPKNNMRGRCEAMAIDPVFGRCVYQCARGAWGVREGRRVCQIHRGGVVVFVQDKVDPYDALAKFLAHLGRRNAGYAEAVRTAARNLLDRQDA
jgi:hypothetical protein